MDPPTPRAVAIIAAKPKSTHESAFTTMDGIKDNFKWFGEGFDGFPKILPEDCVEYALYIIDTTLKDSEIRERLARVHHATKALTKRLLRDFIWQRESFSLDLVRHDGVSFLRGRTNYGDSVEDEWLVVYILRELSKQHADVWIKIVDTQGEFLLIEAANALPRWLNPEIADNRVWMNGGKLLLIPLQQSPKATTTTEPVSRSLTLREAHIYIQRSRSTLIYLPAVEAEAFYRLRNYPNQITESLHHTPVLIPRRLAYILHGSSAYISPAVEAFYLRDPIALRPLQTQGAVRLVFPPDDLVTVQVKFTKVGYAQLKSQRFSAPSSWQSVLVVQKTPKAIAQAEMGMKITSGFEMLLADPQHRDEKSVREIKLLLDDLEVGEAHLASDAEIAKWELREDDESWLDINFEDFENELAGKAKKDAGTVDGGFGDKSAHANLRKIVARFEDFLNDDAAGADGAGYLDDMDNDDDNDGDNADEDSDFSGEGEDQDIGFNEAEFAEMMREMMGLPADTKPSTSTNSTERHNADDMHAKAAVDKEDNEAKNDKEDEEDEGEGFRRVMHEMEAELRDAGALSLDHQPKEPAETRQALRGVQEGHDSPDVGEFEKINEDLQEASIDYNLAKNLLESFKSQAGMAGPGGNILRSMGLQLPRDEDTDH